MSKEFDEILKQTCMPTIEEQLDHTQAEQNEDIDDSEMVDFVDLTFEYERAFEEIVKADPEIQKQIKQLKEIGLGADALYGKINRKISRSLRRLVKQEGNRWNLTHYKFQDKEMEYGIELQPEKIRRSLNQVKQVLDYDNVPYIYHKDKDNDSIIIPIKGTKTTIDVFCIDNQIVATIGNISGLVGYVNEFKTPAEMYQMSYVFGILKLLMGGQKDTKKIFD